MAEQQELRVILRTVADTRGAQQTAQALQGVQRQAQGIQTRATAAGAGAAATSLREVGIAAGIASMATDVLADTVGRLGQAYGDSIQVARDHERILRATSASYGQNAANFTKFAAALAQQTGFTSDAVLEAALSARTLSQNYALTIDQTQKLIRVSADLARVRGIGIAEAFERVQSAIRGEAEASEYLGLTLNDTYIANNALNGSLKNTFNTMTDQQKAQVRYNELLKQSAQFTGLAVNQADSLDASFRRMETSAHNAQLAIGKFASGPTQAGLNLMTRFFQALEEGFAGTDPGAVRFKRFLEELRRDLNKPLVLNIQVAAETAQREMEQAAVVAEQLKQQERELLRLRQLTDSLPPVRLGPPVNPDPAGILGLPGQRIQETITSLTRLAEELERIQQLAAQPAAFANALPTGDFSRATFQAQAALAQIDAAITARQAAARVRADLAAQTRGVLDPRDAPAVRAAQARLRIFDELEGVERELTNLQNAQRQIQQERTQLAIQEAQAVMDMLPAQQQLARLEREIADAAGQRVRLQLESARIAAEQAALPSQFALEDAQARIERARLVIADRGQSREERAAARRTIREESRALPGRELAAFDARQAISAVERQQRVQELSSRAAQIPLELQRLTLEAQLRGSQEIVDAIRQQGQMLDLLAQSNAAAIANQQDRIDAIVAQAIEAGMAAVAKQPTPVALNITVSTPEGQQLTSYEELIEANGQAQMPPTIQVSAVRRE